MSKCTFLRLASLFATVIAISITVRPSTAYNPISPLPFQSRREWIHFVARGVPATLGAGVLLDATGVSSPAVAVAADMGLAARLSQRDASVLTNRLFNFPPSAQVYPDFMRGNWKITASFGGYLFPSQTISRQRITANVLVPGFQKCSIASVADIGKEKVSPYSFTIDPVTGFQNVNSNLAATIDAYLGYPAVNSVEYNAAKNPNRIGIDFVDYKTINAERIELFCNARESEFVTVHKKKQNDNEQQQQQQQVFVCSEYFRQVTFGTGQDVGVPRQVVTNYAHFWTWRNDDDGDQADNKKQASSIKGNLLTAVYLDPQDPMYFEEPSKPVAVYSHTLTGVGV
jgi:hypothetical protein